jgi:type I restriction enzyme S subunit
MMEHREAKNSQLPMGYKQTEVGVIPDDWEVKQLSEIVKPERLISYGIVQTGKFIPNGVKCVRVVDIIDGNIEPEKMITTSLEISNSYQRTILQKNDLMIALRGKIGEVAITENPLIGSNLTRGVALISLRDIYSPKFIQQQLKSSKSKSILESNLNGSALKELSISVLRKIPISFPPTKTEQTAIATALSDADALISSLEKLIAKKRNIKQGAMQKLLQPKEGWVVKKLGDLGKPFGGLSGKSKVDFANGKFPYIPFMNIMSNPIIDVNYFDYVNIGSNEVQNQALKGDLFFNGSSETPEEVGMCSVLLEDIPNLYLNSFCFGYRLNKEYQTNGLYLSYYFRSSVGRKLFYSMAQGATRYNLSKGNFNKMYIPVPPPDEQIQIATILSDMDTEITALETKLEKYRKVKLGMMQNLLTGKIRLV